MQGTSGRKREKKKQEALGIERSVASGFYEVDSARSDSDDQARRARVSEMNGNKSKKNSINAKAR